MREKEGVLLAGLAEHGVSRRSFLKYCTTLASTMALPPAAGLAMAEAMAAARRPSVIWLPFQECTGCTESITRSHSPTIEGMIFNVISLDYQETLMAAAGLPGRRSAAQRDEGQFRQVPADCRRVDSAGTGRRLLLHCRTSNLEILKEAAQGRGSHRRHGLPARLTAAFRKPIRIRPAQCRCPTSSRTSPSSTFQAARPFRW